jgi:hypothetical protein
MSHPRECRTKDRTDPSATDDANCESTRC